ncbi:MAG: diguanylate cyclase [Pigmentiphaga sp.]|nr:diguanylate cyclase [Pigmentiphaga sp.]
MKNKYFKQKEFLALLICWFALLTSLLVYWVHVTDTQSRQAKLAEQQIQQSLQQTVHALALQTETMMGKLEYVARQLANSWLIHDRQRFQLEALSAQQSLPDGTVANVAVVNAQGQMVFSSIDPKQANGLPLVHDRDYFRASFQPPLRPASLFISEPNIGRIIGHWSVFLSYPIERDGQRVGILILTVPTSHLSEALASIYPDEQDSAFIVREDGRYIAHSRRLDAVMGRAVPSSRDFLTNPALDSGHYQAVALSDGTERYYSWRRVTGFPLIIGAGVNKERALHPIASAQRDSFRRNLVGTLVILLLTGLLSRSWFHWLARKQELRIANERLDVTLNSAHDGIWSHDCRTDQIDWNGSLNRLLGIDANSPFARNTWEVLLHPDDLAPFKTALAHFCAQSTQQVFSHEFRLTPITGATVWVAARAGVVEKELTGLPRLLAGTITDISERVLSNQLRHALLEQSVACIVLVNARREILYANARAVDVFGQGSGLDTSTAFAHLNQASFDAVTQNYEALRLTGKTQFEYPMKDKTGAVRWFSIHGVLKDMHDPGGDVVWTLLDITDRHQAGEALLIERKRLDVLLERFPGGVLMEDDENRVVMLNPVAFEWLGLSGQPQDYTGMSHADLLVHIESPLASWLPLASSEEKRQSGTTSEVEMAGGNTLEIKQIEIKDDGMSLGHVWLMFDISQRKQKERDLANLASTDALTRLPNRRSFMARLEEALERPSPHPRFGTYVMIVDIDFFKRVNDTYGHPIGDVVLSSLADMMRSQLREDDCCARLGGEEFSILLTDISEEDALNQAERIRHWIEQHPIATPAGEIAITISIGVASAWRRTSETVLEAADKALYLAKNQGRNRVELWTKDPAPPLNTTVLQTVDQAAHGASTKAG